jgi:translation initiation factor IF-3
MYQGCIAAHDYDMKMRKVRDMLEKGHQVRVVLAATRKLFKIDPDTIDKICVRVLSDLEDTASTVQPAQTTSPLRKDLVFSPTKR